MTEVSKHTYPESYGRGINADLDKVWDLLDLIKPGVIHDDVRSYLAGAICGLMGRVREEERMRVVVRHIKR